KHPNGLYKNSQCTQCHLNPGDPTIRTGKENQIVENAHGPKGTFPLIQRHKDVPCATCHTGRDARGQTSFSRLQPNCNASGQCHADSLPRGTLGNQCMPCHVSGTWDALTFTHDQPFPRDAKGTVAAFPLKGEHKKNACEACHPGRKFAEAATTCASEGCHKKD